MVNLRELAQSDLGITLEGDFALLVDVVSPDGVLHQDIKSMPVSTASIETEAGTPIIISERAVSFRTSTFLALAGSLPQYDEDWFFNIPTAPELPAPKEAHTMEIPPRYDKAIGFFTVYLTKVEQK